MAVPSWYISSELARLDPAHWGKWLRNIRKYSHTMGIWQRINPGLAEHPDDAFNIYVGLDEVYDPSQARDYAAGLYDKEKEDVTDADIVFAKEIVLMGADFERECLMDRKQRASEVNEKIRDWILATVNSGLLQFMFMSFYSEHPGDQVMTTRQMLKSLQHLSGQRTGQVPAAQRTCA
ncbi:uncharacterized protein TrAtP1_007617 [Trichoderma atroviride]|uniref:uncharacterized protein n=1 Tax=Hypocrea atroviridis TaxID=63577 RepID=UPI00332FA1AF|nr:hypothetical protein TrAtP1_007617 [Trichoderma atroviride]